MHYKNLLSGFVLDKIDAELAKEFAIPVTITQTVMKTRPDRILLAQDVLHLIHTLLSAKR